MLTARNGILWVFVGGRCKCRGCWVNIKGFVKRHVVTSGMVRREVGDR